MCFRFLLVYFNGFFLVLQKVESKPKQKVEDGIFGTSGGIGFTKQNELFVGRVAMIGFAVSNFLEYFVSSKQYIGLIST